MGRYAALNLSLMLLKQPVIETELVTNEAGFITHRIKSTWSPDEQTLLEKVFYNDNNQPDSLLDEPAIFKRDQTTLYSVWYSHAKQHRSINDSLPLHEFKPTEIHTDIASGINIHEGYAINGVCLRIVKRSLKTGQETVIDMLDKWTPAQRRAILKLIANAGSAGPGG